MEWLAEARETAADQLDRPISDNEWYAALVPALEKQARIIAREGDADGARVTGRYLGLLAAELIRSNAFMEFTFDLYTPTSPQTDRRTHENQQIDPA